MSCLSGVGVPFDVNETCGKVTGGFAIGWERGTASEANAPEDGRILNRVYENKYFGFGTNEVSKISASTLVSPIQPLSERA